MSSEYVGREKYLQRLIETGQLRLMRGREILTLIVLVAQSPPGLWFELPYARLSEWSGQTRETCSKAIRDLAVRGLVECIPGHGPHQTSKFRILSRSSQ